MRDGCDGDHIERVVSTLYAQCGAVAGVGDDVGHGADIVPREAVTGRWNYEHGTALARTHDADARE